MLSYVGKIDCACQGLKCFDVSRVCGQFVSIDPGGCPITSCGLGGNSRSSATASAHRFLQFVFVRPLPTSGAVFELDRDGSSQAL